jgi:hypothetical protein
MEFKISSVFVIAVATISTTQLHANNSTSNAAPASLEISMATCDAVKPISSLGRNFQSLVNTSFLRTLID